MISTSFLIFLLCLSITKLTLTLILFYRAKKVQAEPNDAVRLAEIEAILSGSPMSIANAVLGGILVLLLILQILYRFYEIRKRQ